MIGHILLPHVKLKEIQLVQTHQEWLFRWLDRVENGIENGDVSASLCLQGILSELAIYGGPKTDWLGVMEEYLTDHDGAPLAYSKRYGERLYRFNFWLQSPVHAVHCRWFIEQVCQPLSQWMPKYADLIAFLIQPNGWIYNPKVSATRHRNRMKSEYMMSMAMGCEILASVNRLSDYAEQFQATLSSVPLTGFLSAEYFRLKALSILQTLEFAPADLAGLLSKCKIELGFSEFAISSKVDDYMGTAKRTARDKPISSPLIGLYAKAIAEFCPDEMKESVILWLKAYGVHLKRDPFDVQAFIIRDEDISFGTDLSPLEIISASFLIANVN